MERKTKVHAEEGKQELFITREFDLPVDLLFRAYTEAEIIQQWMGTKVLQLENKAHGHFAFETSDPSGKVMFRANGTIHRIIPDQQITRTFEMENAPFDVQLEYLDFEKIDEDRSKLTMQVVFRSVTHRDQQLKMPFEYGINMAHARLEEILGQLKK
jgi:uncharacterized protein YndB with AHSA1/START domain